MSPVALAPLAGITAKPGVREKAELGYDQESTAVQLAGRDAYWMGEAARAVEANGAAMIDINMGCPAKKVTNGYSGSALMRDLDHALTLIEAVVEAVDIPVTLKTRLGWDDDTINAPELAQRAESAGIRRIVIHGRTRCQFYKGGADWTAIASVKDAVGIPVIANGDIIDLTSAREALRLSKGDGIMVGRGTQGRPWLLRDISAGLAGGQAPAAPKGRAFVDMVSGHYDAMLSFYGQDLGGKVARKHLGWYMDVVNTDGSLRKRVLTTRNTDEVMAMLPEALDDQVAA